MPLATDIYSGNVFRFMKLEESMVGEDSKLEETCSELAGTHFKMGKKSDGNSGVQKVRKRINCRIQRNSKWISIQSIAAGNDYGRLGNLKPLNGTTWSACVPVWLYNIDLQIRANHSTNHCIAFLMNGPVECLKKLPCVDEKYCPQVTFIGPWDEWMKKAGKYKYLYKMDTEIASKWLQV